MRENVWDTFRERRSTLGRGSGRFISVVAPAVCRAIQLIDGHYAGPITMAMLAEESEPCASRFGYFRSLSRRRESGTLDNWWQTLRIGVGVQGK
jgi:hypothetical protein